MELKVIDENTYKKYALKSPYISIYQLPEWGLLKETNGWIRHLVGLYDNDKLCGVTMLLAKNTPVKKNLFYSPRGYLLDIDDFSLLKVFHEEIIKYVKNHNGFMLKVDPNIIYKIRDCEGNQIKEIQDNFQSFKKLGFKHMGFSKDFEDLQPRNLCRLKLHDTYEDTYNSFTKSTRKNISKVNDMGVCVREVNIDEIDLFVSLLKETANDKNFVIRPTGYYKKMKELMDEYVKLYVAYIDTESYYKNIWINLESTRKELDNLNNQMKKINIGEKVKKHHEELESKISNLEKKLEEAKGLKDAYNKINIGSLMAIYLGNEAVTFMSGTTSSYKEFGPKYAMYDYVIKEAINKKLDYVNFYGISGNLEKNSKYYGIYEIKKGFNPEIIELIGEFDYIISPLYYHLYKVALKLYKMKKVLFKR